MKVNEIISNVKDRARRQSRPRLTLADLNRLRQLRKLRSDEQQAKSVRLKRIYGSHEDASAASKPTKPTKIANKTPAPKPNQPNNVEIGDHDADRQDQDTENDLSHDAGKAEDDTPVSNETADQRE